MQLFFFKKKKKRRRKERECETYRVNVHNSAIERASESEWSDCEHRIMKLTLLSCIFLCFPFSLSALFSFFSRLFSFDEWFRYFGFKIIFFLISVHFSPFVSLFFVFFLWNLWMRNSKIWSITQYIYIDKRQKTTHHHKMRFI